MLELSELDPKLEVIETEDTPPSLDKLRKTETLPVDSLSQHQILLRADKTESHSKPSERRLRRDCNLDQT